MKSLLLALMLLAPSAFAASGIDCKSIDNALEVSTEEGMESGDNVITLSVIAPWAQKSAITFSKMDGQLSVNREEGTVYMASNSKGQALTLVVDGASREGVTVSTAYFKIGGKVYVETLICE